MEAGLTSWFKLLQAVLRNHLMTADYFAERNDSTVFCASARFGEKRAALA